MCFKKWDKKVKNFSYCDIACIKWGSMAFILVVVKGIDIIWHWNLLEHVSIWWLVAIFVVLAIKPTIKMFGKEKGVSFESPKIKREEIESQENVPPEA